MNDYIDMLKGDLRDSNARLVRNVEEGNQRARDYELAADGCEAKRAHEAQQLLRSRCTTTGRRV